jgi:hypothetical protein
MLKTQNDFNQQLSKEVVTLKLENNKLSKQIEADYLKEWETEAAQKLSECQKKSEDKPEKCICSKDNPEACKNKSKKIVEVISSAPNPKGDKNKNDIALRFNRIGAVLLNDASDLLKVDLGIDRKSFIGAGISSPFTVSQSDDSTGATGIPEYWAPNKNEDDMTVVTCRKDNPSIGDTNQKVGELLGISESGLSVKREAHLKCKNHRHLVEFLPFLKDTSRPILFRCNQFPGDFYLGTVGRKESKRVFFSRLSDVINLKISDACTKTGRELKYSEEQSLFIWILAPMGPEEAIPATWENLVHHFSIFEGI